MAPDLVLTVAHVVHEATSITVGAGGAVKNGGGIVSAEVVGIDRSVDLALVRTDRPVPGHVFQLADSEPKVGEQVALIGYPFGDPGLSARFGHVGDLGRTERYQDDEGRAVEVSDLFTTDAAINPGNSGGPVITPAGRVVGVVSGKRAWTSSGEAAEGTGWAVSIVPHRGLINRWRHREPVASVSCGSDTGDPARDESVAVRITSAHSQAPWIAQSLVLHGTAINDGQYDVAYRLFTPAMRARQGGVEQWSRGLRSSVWRAILVADITTIETGRARAAVGLVTEQASADGPDGQTCSVWRIDYTMVLLSGVWRIDKAALPGADPKPCS